MPMPYPPNGAARYFVTTDAIMVSLPELSSRSIEQQFNLLPRIMAVGCLGYPGASTVVSRPPDGLLHYWQIPGPQP